MGGEDPVEALAKVLFETRQHAEYPGSEERWEDWQSADDGIVARAQARAALAYARGLVPEFPKEDAQHKQFPPEVRQIAALWWNACRAETLRRLGGEGP